jgi:tetratricopeptide (TPR) repeat protein
VTRTARLLALLTLTASLGAAVGPRAQDRLSTTKHPPVPARSSQYWLVPDSAGTRASQNDDTPAARLARGAAAIAAGDFAAGLQLVTGADVSGTPLAQYARYYAAVALHELGRNAEADAALTPVVEADPIGHLAEAASQRLADIALSLSDAERAADILDDLADEKLLSPEDVFLRLGTAEEAAGETADALEAYRRVYYE